MSVTTSAAIAVAPLPINQNWIRGASGAPTRPAFVSGLSDDFRAGHYRKPFADIAKESRQ